MALSPLERRYRARLEDVRGRTVAAVAAEYDLDPADIVTSFQRFVDRVAPRIEAGQAAAQLLTVAFLEELAHEQGLERWEPLPEDDKLPGTTVEGKPLDEGMEGITGLVLSAIDAGKPADEAIRSGLSYVERFTDNEVRAAADREQERQEKAPEIVGWEGVVKPGSCDQCRANEGRHALSETMYRHPNCGCERVPVFAGA